MQVPRWRNVQILKNTLILAISQSTISITKTHFAAIHSTPTTWEKRKNKWNGNKWNDDASRLQQPPKNNIKYVTRQKRADAKRALKDLLFHSGSSKTSFQGEGPIWPSDAEHSVGCNGKRKSKSSARHSRKSHPEKRKRRHRRESFSEDLGDAETIFQATFGNRWYTWSFNMSSFQSSTSGFEWRDHQNWTNQRFKKWDTTSESESDDEFCSVGSHSDRTILGLPPTGPLKIEDVKNAFRLSALKWHPDKHQGPSQAMAEEKFKLCVDAYKSLCDALT